jgi:hypothetical protein
MAALTRMPLGAALVAAGLLGSGRPGRASECDTPQGTWLLCEDFEAGGAGWASWFAQSPFVECLGCSGSTNDPARIQLLDDPAAAHDGHGSLYMPAAASASYQGASLTYRSCAGTPQAGCNPLVNYDELYFRAWVKLAADHAYVHHFMSVGGTQPDGYWDGDGTAGCRPNGQDAAGTTLDFDTDHELFFYTYFPEMHCDDIYVGSGYCGDMQPGLCEDCADRGMPCTGEPECCWGNLFSATPRPVLPRGEWVCLEMMMRLNSADPVQADGEMAFWVNGTLGHRQTGMHWRDTNALGLNKVWVQHYIASGDASQPNRIWWDDIIAATARIGCGTPPAADGATADGGAPPDSAPPADGAAPPTDGHGSTDDGAGSGDADVPATGALVSGCACADLAGASWLLAVGLALGHIRRRR